MPFFINDKLNLPFFDPALLRATNNLGEVLAAAARTQSARIESTHFLLALTKIKNGVTQKLFEQHGISSDQLESGLVECVARQPGALPPPQLTPGILDASAVQMVVEVESICPAKALRAGETHLLFAILKHLTAAVHKIFQEVGISVDEFIKQVQPPSTSVSVFGPANTPSTQPLAVQLDAFSSSGRRVLELMKTETEALGYPEADPRHLLLALLEYEGGATHLALHQQASSPKKIHEAVMLSLRSRARKTPSQVPLDTAHLQPSVQNILTLSGEQAGRDHADKIAEVHLLRAFLSQDTFARRLLRDEKVNLDTMQATAAQFDVADEPSVQVADDSMTIDEVRTYVEQAIVGQSEAIGLCLPFIQRMRFGMPRRRRPAGVFLFCGQSGTGKTEMAKVMAKAIYGSEEDLILMEMGQFQSKESINIFIGAPPGYVGYGEGKLTNGLRDNPRAVVLFDEVEKAHPEVYNALLRFLDEGKIDDPAGPVRDGTQCLIVLTSNVGAKNLSELWKQVKGKPDARWQLRQQLREELLNQQFRPEFLNRVDEIILFKALEQRDLAAIAQWQLALDTVWLREEKRVELTIDLEVYEHIGEFCYRLKDEGARAVSRVTQFVVINPVIDFLESQQWSPPVRLAVTSTPGPEGCEPTGHVTFAATGQSTSNARALHG
ncbi:MAG: AAA family ATPase [Deltaproteobacteria bacterium]|nr:AAA family ATPase [Deltaproteobacteria bacterium]